MRNCRSSLSSPPPKVLSRPPRSRRNRPGHPWHPPRRPRHCRCRRSPLSRRCQRGRPPPPCRPPGWPCGPRPSIQVPSPCRTRRPPLKPPSSCRMRQSRPSHPWRRTLGRAPRKSHLQDRNRSSRRFPDHRSPRPARPRRAMLVLFRPRIRHRRPMCRHSLPPPPASCLRAPRRPRPVSRRASRRPRGMGPPHGPVRAAACRSRRRPASAAAAVLHSQPEAAAPGRMSRPPHWALSV